MNGSCVRMDCKELVPETFVVVGLCELSGSIGVGSFMIR